MGKKLNAVHESSGQGGEIVNNALNILRKPDPGNKNEADNLNKEDLKNEDHEALNMQDTVNILKLLGNLFCKTTDSGDDLILDYDQANGVGKLLNLLSDEVNRCYLDYEGF